MLKNIKCISNATLSQLDNWKIKNLILLVASAKQKS